MRESSLEVKSAAAESREPVKVLDYVVAELRAEEAPELPWDAMEKTLFARIDRAERAREAKRVPAPRGLSQAFMFAAAAAAVVLGIGVAAQSRAPASGVVQATAMIDSKAFPKVPGSPGELALEALRSGDVIETTTEEIVFELPGVVRWELAPASRVVIRASAGPSGLGHVIALERGSVHAEVTPRAPSEGLVEAFAVEVERTRVAVHGTAFRVTRVDDGADVDVEHGAVAIGPVGYTGATTGRLLVGPGHARFSLDGGRSAAFLPPAAAPPILVAEPAAAPAPAPPERTDSPQRAETRVAPSALSPVRSGGLPEMRPAAEPAHVDTPETSRPAAASASIAAAPPVPPFLTTGSIRATLARCFEQAYEPGASGVKVSVRSTFRLKLRSDGSIQSALFDPPLRPEFQQCAGSIMSGRFAETSGGDVTIPLELGP